MKVQYLIKSLLCAACVSGSAYANDKVESSYVPATYQKVCKGKTQGETISFPHKGIIWNGTCEPQFFPTKSKGITGNEPELSTACVADSNTKSITVNGSEIKGKCALGFTPPSPKS